MYEKTSKWTNPGFFFTNFASSGDQTIYEGRKIDAFIVISYHLNALARSLHQLKNLFRDILWFLQHLCYVAYEEITFLLNN